jgi:hypothetical protein
MKKTIKYIVTFIFLILGFNFLLFIGSIFPSNFIEKNVKESSEILIQEGNSYKLFKYLGIINNNYTDSIMINEAYSIDNTNPIYSYMSARKNYKKGITQESLLDTKGELISINSNSNNELTIYDPVGELSEFLDGNIDTSINYARYWHGYLPILRTLLLFFNISEIRIILLIIFTILFIYLIYLLKDKFGIIISLIFGVSLIIEGYFFVSYSLESSPVFIVMMISSIMLLKRIDKIQNFYLYIFIISCITNFVDYLTVPLITLAIPLYIFILYKQKMEKQLNYKYYLKLIIKASIIWLIGYGMTWLSKWVIYDIIYNEGLIKSAIEQVVYRTQSYNEHTTDTITQIMLFLISSNLIYICTICCFALCLLLILKNKYSVKLNKIKNILNESIPIFVISLMPLVWYRALANHTVLHVTFVYRHMLIFLCGILLCWKKIFIIEKNKKLN